MVWVVTIPVAVIVSESTREDCGGAGDHLPGHPPRSRADVLHQGGGPVGEGRGPALRQVPRPAGAGVVLDHPDRRHDLPSRRPASARHRRDRRVGADPRHRAGQRRRHRLLAGVGRGEGDPRGAVVLRRHLPRVADGAARGDRPPRSGRDDHRARQARPASCQQILDEKTNPWGITVQSVEIRDVRIPADLEDAMSRQAQAERERQARIILGTAETEIAEHVRQAPRSSTRTTRSPCTCGP